MFSRPPIQKTNSALRKLITKYCKPMGGKLVRAHCLFDILWYLEPEKLIEVFTKYQIARGMEIKRENLWPAFKEYVLREFPVIDINADDEFLDIRNHVFSPTAEKAYQNIEFRRKFPEQGAGFCFKTNSN